MTRSSCCLISTSHEIGQDPCARVPLFSKVKLKVDKPCPPCTSLAFMKKKETMCIFPTDNGYNNLVVNGSKHERFFRRVHSGKVFSSNFLFFHQNIQQFQFFLLSLSYDITMIYHCIYMQCVSFTICSGPLSRVWNEHRLLEDL